MVLFGANRAGGERVDGTLPGVPATDWSRADSIALAVLARHGAVAHIGAFLAAGLTRHQVAAIMRRGVIERPRIGWFVDPALPWQAKCAVRVGGVLGCVSAADSWGLPIPATPRRCIHVVVPPDASHLRHHRNRRWQVRAGDDGEVELHWVRPVDPVAGWRVGLIDALLQLVGCVPDDWFVAAVDAALHRPFDGEPLLSERDLTRLERLLPRRKRPLLELVDPRAGSCLETLLRLGMLRRGIGPVVPQFSPDGRRSVDFLVGGRLIVEADGAAFHDPEADALRDAEFRALGYEVLRVPSVEILTDLEHALDRVEAALAAL